MCVCVCWEFSRTFLFCYAALTLGLDVRSWETGTCANSWNLFATIGLLALFGEFPCLTGRRNFWFDRIRDSQRFGFWNSFWSFRYLINLLNLKGRHALVEWKNKRDSASWMIGYSLEQAESRMPSRGLQNRLMPNIALSGPLYLSLELISCHP